MILWEALRRQTVTEPPSRNEGQPVHVRRLPYETRCSAVTKSGTRCRGRVRPDSEFCAFHDPVVAEKRRRALSNAKSRRRRLSHLPDGYLKKLTNRTAIGDAMDRLYREVRLGIVTPEMGSVLFGILTRLLDSDLCLPHRIRVTGRARADKLRPKLGELLTRAERAAWRKAVANAPEEFVVGDTGEPEPTQRPAPPPAPKPGLLGAVPAHA
jgi:hypothetical protein